MREPFLRKAANSLGLGCIFGSILAAGWHAMTCELHFAPGFYSLSNGGRQGGYFDAVPSYGREMSALLLGVAVLALPPVFRWVKRFVLGWWAGITSILTCATALVVAVLLGSGSATPPSQWAAGLSLVVVVASIELWRGLRKPAANRDIRLNLSDGRTEARPADSSPSDPIRRWGDDVLGRRAVVELLALRSLQLRDPVVALHGARGDGKTSVLNLLRVAVQGNAVVVPFNAWLPGSEATLVADLFRNVATECRKVISVPQLRKRARAFVRAVGSSVGYLAGLREMVAAQSQWEEVEELRHAFERVPKPILVLVDEIDRMQKEELLAFLKVLRGADSIRNVSFICAFSDEEVRSVTDLSSEYLEKFFPVSVRLAPPPQEAVFAYLRTELRDVLKERPWFTGEEALGEFARLLEQLWTDALSRLCTNLRKAGLLRNDVAAAGWPIAGEVNPLDLVGIEAIRRFCPSVYQMVRDNPQHLTNARKDFFEEDRKSDEFYKRLSEEVDKSAESGALRALLGWLFPKSASHSGSRASIHFSSRRSVQDSDLEDAKRICVADYFEVYFRASVPEEMFSNADLQRFLEELRGARDEEAVAAVFDGVLDSIPKGHRRRDDFMWRVSRSLDKLDDSTAEFLAYAVAMRAKEYTYDLMGLGELGRGLAITFAAAQKISATPAVQLLLEGSMARASDDTFAVRLLDGIENRDRNRILREFGNVDAKRIEQVFMDRMRERYGPQRTADPPTSQLDWWAFRKWAAHSPQDQREEHDFWNGLIGGSRKKLAQAINFIYPGNVAWQGSPASIVDELFPLTEFKKLLKALAEEDLDEVERSAIERMEKLLGGMYQPSPGMDFVRIEPSQASPGGVASGGGDAADPKIA